MYPCNILSFIPYANIVSHTLPVIAFHFTVKRNDSDDESGIGPSISDCTESITFSEVSCYFLSVFKVGFYLMFQIPSFV